MKHLKLFCVTAVLLLSTSMANAQTSGQCGTNLFWSFNSSTGVLTIIGTGDMYDFNWPTPSPWYNYRADITSLSLPAGLTSIGTSAFWGCTGLTSVTIPDLVETIGADAFWLCTGLTSLTIGNSVRTIGDYAFSNCRSLTSVTIPDSVIEIGYEAFTSCTALTSVTFGNSVETIGDFAFTGCGLTTVTIPESVTVIGQEAFASCRDLSSATIFAKTIGLASFESCINLTSVTIGSSVETIGNSAFEGCPNLTSVINQSLVPQTINVNVFDINTYINAMLYVPAESIGQYRADTSWLLFMDIQPIEDSTNVVEMLRATSLPVGYYSILGRKLPQAPESGMYIIRYDNGTVEKVIR